MAEVKYKEGSEQAAFLDFLGTKFDEAENALPSEFQLVYQPEGLDAGAALLDSADREELVTLREEFEVFWEHFNIFYARVRLGEED